MLLPILQKYLKVTLTTTETDISTNINTGTEIGNTVTETDCGHTERVHKRAFSGRVIPDTLPETQEVDFFSEINQFKYSSCP